MVGIYRYGMLLGVGLMLSACAGMIPGLGEATPAVGTQPPPTITAAPTATARPTVPSTVSPTPPGAWIHANPDSGNPGQVIQIEGFYPGGLSQTDLAAQDYLTHADICWNGCAGGMDESVEVNWSRSEAGRFSIPFTVPPIPWLADDGLHLMQAGDYALDLIHLDPANYGCKTSSDCKVTPEASTTFHLTKDAPHPPCEGQTCGTLSFNPASAAPGETVQVTGWAPLLEIIGIPFGYDLALVTSQGTPTSQDTFSFPVVQAMDGTISGSFVMPQIKYNGQPLTPGTYTMALWAGSLGQTKGGPLVLINATPIQVTAALAWTAVRHPVPLWISPSTDLGNSNLATDPLHPQRMAYCAGGNIMASDDAGQTWSAIPEAGVSQLSPGSQVEIGDQPPACINVTLDSAHPDSFYAEFGAVSKQYGAPPIYFAGAVTMDRGKTWQLAPVPSVQSFQQIIAGNFGGFWTNGTVVQALYYGKLTADNRYGSLLAKQTGDGGATWSEASLACPASGPCVRWGAAPAQGGGMGAPMPQAALVSADGGQTWQDSGESVELRMTGPHELVALTDSQAVLISGAETFPLRYTADSGKTWQALALPPLPVANPGYPLGYPGLQMLPDGSLMSMVADTGQWYRLAPSAQDWCQTGLAFEDKNPSLLNITNGRVWWLSGGSQDVKSAPVSALQCQN